MSPHETPAKKTPKATITSDSVRLAELLKKRRKELKLTLADAEQATKIRLKYLRYIESGQYDRLPDDVYSRGYVKNYAEFLGFDTKEILRIYTQERHQVNQTKAKPHKQKNPLQLKPIDSQTLVLTPRSIVIILASVLVIGLFSYVGWQFSQLAAPPKISLNNQDQSNVATSFVIVSGQVDSGSDVFINDSPILSTADGSFSERVAVVDGANQIKISAKNKFGKESSKTIVVTAKLDKTQQAAVPTNGSTTTIDGVELVVKITKQATWIIVQTDGQDSFRGTMLPGTQQRFKAKNNVKLTSGNAGSTDVILTNSIEVKKDLGSLGRDGEAKTDLVFNKDTDVQ